MTQIRFEKLRRLILELKQKGVLDDAHLKMIDNELEKELERAESNGEKKACKRIGLVFETNIIIDEEEDADGWYNNLKDEMRRVV